MLLYRISICCKVARNARCLEARTSPDRGGDCGEVIVASKRAIAGSLCSRIARKAGSPASPSPRSAVRSKPDRTPGVPGPENSSNIQQKTPDLPLAECSCVDNQVQIAAHCEAVLHQPAPVVTLLQFWHSAVLMPRPRAV